MANPSHAMSHAAHGMHGMEPRMGRPEARAVIDTSCRSHSGAVTTMHISSTFPMNTAALAVNGLRVLCMRRCLT